jgi:hypothetical protein
MVPPIRLKRAGSARGHNPARNLTSGTGPVPVHLEHRHLVFAEDRLELVVGQYFGF